MPAITSIECFIVTADVKDAGTDGGVYLGICGREFHCDYKGDGTLTPRVGHA